MVLNVAVGGLVTQIVLRCISARDSSRILMMISNVVVIIVRDLGVKVNLRWHHIPHGVLLFHQLDVGFLLARKLAAIAFFASIISVVVRSRHQRILLACVICPSLPSLMNAKFARSFLEFSVHIYDIV